MILGFLIIGKIGFISFEHYFENFPQYVKSRPDFFNFVDNTEYKPGTYSHENVSLDISDVDGKILVGIVYLSRKGLADSHRDQIIRIATDISNAEKQVTHEVLKSKYASELLD